MTRVDHVAVVVPAADEEESIEACLAALARATDRLAAERPDLEVDVVVVLDACRDRTADLLPAHVHPVVSDARCVGAARGLGSRAALGRAAVPPAAVWTAHTDADSEVPPHWLCAQVAAAEQGADLVLGTVAPTLTEAHLSRWRLRYRPVDGHRHVHGANFGIRGDVLLDLGGWPGLTSGEDVELARRAFATRRRVVRPADLVVTTSARRSGRAPSGFADYLVELD